MQLAKQPIRTKKSFGQHFLKDRHLIDKILDALEAVPGDTFLEIGPGPGTLTLPFNQRGFGLKVVELDRDMVHFLEGLTFEPPVEIIEGDALRVDLDPLIQNGTKVFSNLPYQTSVPITARLLEYADSVPLMVMMYQKEVALRIRADAGCKAYGIISVLAQCFYDIDLHFDVGAHAFRPPPKVTSQVIRFRRKEQPLIDVEDLPAMTKLVQLLFNQRRKMIGSILKKANFAWSSASLVESYVSCGFDPQARAETLTPSDYAVWVKRLKEVS